MYWRSQCLDKFLGKMIEWQGGKNETFAVLKFNWEHPPEQQAISWDDIGKLLGWMRTDLKLPLSKEIVRESLNLDDLKFLQLKDESFLPDEGLKRWIATFPDLTPKFTEITALRNNFKEEFRLVLKPKKTVNGVVIDLTTLTHLLQFAYPQTLGPGTLRYGINADSTELGGWQTTAGCIRLMDNRLAAKGIPTNSGKHSWCFSLHKGSDTWAFLQENTLGNTTLFPLKSSIP